MHFTEPQQDQDHAGDQIQNCPLSSWTIGLNIKEGPMNYGTFIQDIK